MLFRGALTVGQDLFQQVGDVKKVKILYDRSGRSEGSAEVFFVRKGDAEDAVKKYNNVELDGKAMKITLLGSALQSSRDSRDEQHDSFRGGRGRRGGGGYSSRLRVQYEITCSSKLTFYLDHLLQEEASSVEEAEGGTHTLLLNLLTHPIERINPLSFICRTLS